MESFGQNYWGSQKFIKIKILSIISNTEVKESLQRAALRPHESVSAAEILTQGSYTSQNIYLD